MFLRHSKLPDKDLAADLAATLAEIDFGRNFSVKFERAMHYFDFEDCFD